MVDVVDNGFIAVVIDTVTALPRWRISVCGHELVHFYRKMLGDPDVPSRGTLIVSALHPCHVNAIPTDKDDPDPRDPPDALTLLRARLHIRVANISPVVMDNHHAAFLQVP
jgi:hypothetical protein